MAYKRRTTATKKAVTKKAAIEEKPKFRITGVKYFLTYIGPPCALRIAGVPVQRIRRNREYEVDERVYKAFLGVEGYCVEKRVMKVEI